MMIRKFDSYMGMDQYLLIPFLGEWTSILTQLNFDVNRRGTIGFDTLPYLETIATHIL
jgi:hypothetical protein